MIAGVVAFIGVCIVSAYVMALTQKPPAAYIEPATHLEFQMVLARAGLTPAVLVAAGVEAHQLDEMFFRARRELGRRVQTLRDADAARDRHQSRIGTLDPSDHASDEERERHRQAHADLQAAKDEAEAVLAAVRSVAESEFTESQVQTLHTLRRNQHRDLPIEFLVVERSDDEWIALKEALSAQRLAEQHKTELPPHFAQLITKAEAEPAAMRASASLSHNTQAVEERWRSKFMRSLGSRATANGTMQRPQ